MQKGLKDVFITKDLLIFNNEDAVGSLAEEKEMILLIYEGEVIDATKFQKKHPGGAIILEDYNGYDISEIFNHPNAHKHSK